MPIRIQEDKKQIFISVTELAEEETSGSRTTAGIPVGRLAAGRKIHSEYQSGQANSFSGFRKEVPVDYQIEYKNYHFFVQGRIDGIYEKDGVNVVEEIKSVIVDPLEFENINPENYANYCRQLNIYCYLLEQMGLTPVQGFLVFVNLVDQNKKPIEIAYNSETTTQFIYRRLDLILQQVRQMRADSERKQSSANNLRFPFPQMRNFQDEMIDDIDGALLSAQSVLISAPTGIGKTMGALFPALRFVLSTNRTLFYLTSKTTQQRIVQQSVDILNEQSDVEIQAITLQAKEKICPQDEQICHEAFCPLIRNYSERKFPQEIFSELLSTGNIFPEKIKTVAHEHQLCPFELSLDLSLFVDLIICDYNYVFDPRVALKRFFDRPEKMQKYLVIIDEAHNLVNRARDYYSHEINRDELLAVLYECQKRISPLFDEFSRIFQQLESVFQELESFFAAQQAPKNVVEIEDGQFRKFQATLDDLMLEYYIFKKLNHLLDFDDPIEYFYFKHKAFTYSLALEGDEFVCYFDRSGGVGALKIQCLDPAEQLNLQLEKFYAAIGISATLVPLHFYQKILGFPESSLQKSYPSPFPPENRKIVIIPQISTRYKQREYGYAQIAEIIQDVVRLKPGNYAAFFPSFSYLNQVENLLYLHDFDVIIQRGAVSEAERQMILEQLKEPDENHLLLAVQGGIFSEGVDYPGAMLIGAFVISPALPAFTFEQELMKRYFQEKYGQGFEYAYMYPGMNRVIQSVGRVIRTEEDRGLIVLIGQRFAEEFYNSNFPDDWYESTPMELIPNDYLSEIEKFWLSQDFATKAV